MLFYLYFICKQDGEHWRARLLREEEQKVPLKAGQPWKADFPIDSIV